MAPVNFDEKNLKKVLTEPLAAEVVIHRKQEVVRNRISRNLRRAQQRAWVEKKRSYFTGSTFTIGNVVNF